MANDLLEYQDNLPASPETASSAVAAQAKALVEARYKMAIARPRDLDVARNRILKDCQRPGFAEIARYNKPIGKGVVGPSIRFAESAIRNMGNIIVETMTVYDDAEKRIVRVTVTDLEANVPYSQDVTITKSVERKKKQDGDLVLGQRKNSYGDTVYILAANDDDILNKQNALISKAIRTLGLRLIPADIIDEAMEQVIRTLSDKDAKDPDAAKNQLFDAFARQGVPISDLKAFLGHDAAVLSSKEMVDLRGIFNALKEGETTWREVMDSRADAGNTDKLEQIKELFGLKKAGLSPADSENVQRVIDKNESKSFAKALALLKAA